MDTDGGDNPRSGSIPVHGFDPTLRALPDTSGDHAVSVRIVLLALRGPGLPGTEARQALSFRSSRHDAPTAAGVTSEKAQSQNPALANTMAAVLGLPYDVQDVNEEQVARIASAVCLANL